MVGSENPISDMNARNSRKYQIRSPKIDTEMARMLSPQEVVERCEIPENALHVETRPPFRVLSIQISAVCSSHSNYAGRFENRSC